MLVRPILIAHSPDRSLEHQSRSQPHRGSEPWSCLTWWQRGRLLPDARAIEAGGTHTKAGEANAVSRSGSLMITPDHKAAQLEAPEHHLCLLQAQPIVDRECTRQRRGSGSCSPPA
jgi:hypothetical protein